MSLHFLTIVTTFIFFQHLAARPLKTSDASNDLNVFTIDLHWQPNVKTLQIKPTLQIVKNRILTASNDEATEPFNLRIYKDSATIKKITDKIAQASKTLQVYDLFTKEVQKKSIESQNYVDINITKEWLDYINLEKIVLLKQKSHLQISIPFSSYSQAKIAEEIIYSLRPFLTNVKQAKLKKTMSQKKTISLDELLLPDFAAKRVKKFSRYRGPNCFQAALGFADPFFVTSNFLNIKREQSHHASMINHDELWRALNEYFYVVDPKLSPLKYGDILVFLATGNKDTVITYQMLKHASVYLFDQFSFSKESKSADSPYTVKTVAKEWELWQHLHNDLAILAFRKGSSKLGENYSNQMIDWLY